SLNQNSFGRRSVQRKRTKQPFNDCLILFIYSLSTGFDKEPKNNKSCINCNKILKTEAIN
ncbi:hypothetical protein VKX94_10640, partial [Lactobacillus helveticus]|uniref:hypothetical protein n=1 Tax=Lactobacillus helveticus TaxID=1587 RepID=UPI002A69E36B